MACSNDKTFEIEVRTQFEKADKDKNGTLDKEEIKTILKEFFDDITEEEAELILKDCDSNNDNQLDFNEYLDLCKELRTPQQTKEEMKAAFEEVDKDGNGSIDIKELKSMTKKAGMKLSKKELKQMMSDADTDKNGTVDFDEFVKVIFG